MTFKNPSAFPIPALTLSNGVGYPTHPGMTLRDWFAGQALAANADNVQPHDDVARDCYKYADAMLAERAKGQGE